MLRPLNVFLPAALEIKRNKTVYILKCNITIIFQVMPYIYIYTIVTNDKATNPDKIHKSV